ncbi:phosphopantetheine-binding protein [Oricola cellulosilytica]|uniref:Acyl carrier protein n=1 Tax=Oricola cellulosilytica TaxID=1429082 RepID=A0A4R0PDU7_9HYPH|nr:phosphopantetheine-binding protein [Oricola cellulosilytica]TCD15955.1 acyl carrier protein [Oricola cellulosilytica]
MTTVLDTTKRIIAEKAELDADAIKAETVLADLDVQSLELAEIIFDLEDEFDIEIELNAAAAWQKLKTVGDVADAVSELVTHNA